MWTKPPQNGYVNVYPGARDGNEWSPEAYSPMTRLFYSYVGGTNEPREYTTQSPQTVAGHLHLGGVLQPITRQGPTELSEPDAGRSKPHTDNAIQPTGTLSAIDVDNGQIEWQCHSRHPALGGVLAAPGNLVSAGGMNGNFDAFNARTGRGLWHFPLGAGLNAPPATYRVNVKQYAAVAGGGNAKNGNPIPTKELGFHFGDEVAIFAVSGAPNSQS